MVSCIHYFYTFISTDGATDNAQDGDEWLAAVSGLEIGARSPADGPVQMLVEYLTGEGGPVEDQFASSKIARLFIVGDSMTTILEAVNADGFANGTNSVAKKLVREVLKQCNSQTDLLSAALRPRDHDLLTSTAQKLHLSPPRYREYIARSHFAWCYRPSGWNSSPAGISQRDVWPSV